MTGSASIAWFNLVTPFVALGVNFDGSTYLGRNAALAGSDSSQLTGSLWFTHASSIPSEEYIFNSFPGSSGLFLRLNADKTIIIHLENGQVLDVTWDLTAYFDGNWHVFTFSVDTNFSAGNKLHTAQVDGASVSTSAVIDAGSAFSLNFSTAANLTIGADLFGSGKTLINAAEFWLMPGTYLDMTSGTNIAKFVAGGHPVDLGADGSTPTGSPPAMYLSVRSGGVANDFLTNRGTIGNLTVTTGSLSLSGTNP